MGFEDVLYRFFPKVYTEADFIEKTYSILDKAGFNAEPYVKRVEKPWGYELIFTEKDLPYAAKLLHVNAGCRLSLQYHEIKKETLILASGSAKILLDSRIIDMVKNHGYSVKPLMRHRIIAVSDCDIFEASTKEEGKTVRLEDDYKRLDETEADRQKR